MRKRVQIALAILLASVAGAIAWQVLRPHEREPVYEGKRLSRWLEQYMANHWVAARRNSPLDKQAQDAIQQIGTNAIPASAAQASLPS